MIRALCRVVPYTPIKLPDGTLVAATPFLQWAEVPHLTAGLVKDALALDTCTLPIVEFTVLYHEEIPDAEGEGGG